MTTPLDVIVDAIVDSSLGGTADACATLARSIMARLRQSGFRVVAAGDQAATEAAGRDAVRVALCEEDRQLTLMALAALAGLRPGFADALGLIGDQMKGRELFERFRELGVREPITPATAAARESAVLIETATTVLAKDLAATSFPDLRALLTELVGAVRRRDHWVADLQSGLYVNCVYCGHRYGPGETTPVSMADALKAHVVQCPDHPMSALADAGVAAYHALKSYQFGNAAPDLAEGVAAKLNEALARAGRKL